MAQCRCQNQSKAAEFWEDPRNTENSCCTQMVSWISTFMRRVSYCCPQNPDSDLFFQKKVQWCSYIVARVYLYAHLAFQALITSSELEIVVKWTMAANFFSFLFTLFYLREHIVEWFKSGLFLLVMKRNKSPAHKNGICSPTNKMLGCGLLAHCGNRRTIIL